MIPPGPQLLIRPAEAGLHHCSLDPSSQCIRHVHHYNPGTHKIFSVSGAKVTTACQLCDCSQRLPCSVHGEGSHSSKGIAPAQPFQFGFISPWSPLRATSWLSTIDTFSSYRAASPLQSADSGHTIMVLEMNLCHVFSMPDYVQSYPVQFLLQKLLNNRLMVKMFEESSMPPPFIGFWGWW